MNTVTKLKAIEFFDGLHFATIITNLYAIYNGVPLYHAVLAQSVYSAVVLLMEVPTGLVADKFGRKTSVVLGYVMGALGLVALIISPTVIGLYVTQLLRATGSALISGASEALLFEASKEQGLNYTRQSSIVISNGIAGLCVAGVISGIVYARYDESSFVPLLWATVAMQLIAVGLALALRVSHMYERSSILKKELRMWEMLASLMTLMRKNKTIFAFTMVGLLTVCNEYYLYGTYGPYFEEFGVSNFWVGAAFSLGLLVNFFLQRNVYKIERHLTFEKAFVLIKLGTILGYFGLALATQDTLLVIILISTIGVFNIERPIVSDIVNQELDSSVRATVLSGMSLMSRFSRMALTLVLGGVVAGSTLRVSYVVMGLFVASGLAISYWLLVRCGCVRRFVHPRTAII